MSIHDEALHRLFPIIPGAYHRQLTHSLRSVPAPTLQEWLRTGVLHEWLTQGTRCFLSTQPQDPLRFSRALTAIPTFLPSFTIGEIGEWMNAVREISDNDETVFEILPDHFTELDAHTRTALYRLVRTSAYRSVDAAGALYWTGARHILSLPQNLLPLLLRCLHTAATFDPTPLPSLLPLLGPILRSLPAESREPLTERIGKIAQTFPAAVARLFRALTRAYDEVGEERVLAWMTAGADLAERNAEAGEAFFALESRTSLLLLHGQSLEVTLEQIAAVLIKYLHMIGGTTVGLDEVESLTFPLPLASAPGDVLPLPSTIDIFPSYEENARLYRVLAAQHAGRLAFGTYDCSLSSLWSLLPAEAQNILKRDDDERDDITSYFARFPYAKQLEALFLFIENRRISQCLAQVYHGLRADLGWAESQTQLLSPLMSNILRSIPPQQVPTIGPDATVYDSLRLATELHLLLLGQWQNIAGDPASPKVEGTHVDNPRVDMTQDQQGGGGQRQTLSAQDQEALERLLAVLRTLEKNKPSRDAKKTMHSGLIGTVITAKDSESTGEEDAKEEANRRRAQARGISYRYDEWDYLIDDYRTQWCYLREVPIVGDDGAFYSRTLATYTEVTPEIKREFQRLRPRAYRQVNGLEDGEEIDLNACIAARVDYLTGVAPSAKLYTARQALERDVAALFLLDMSASTDSPLSGREDIRIIDLMKEALVLLSSALDEIGDAYAVYGFSSYGRRNVEMYPVKHFAETLSAGVRGRIGGLQPQRSTRMGTAIRHATRKLREVSSRAKFLVLISDGYPEDADYGPSKHAPTYGVRDTMMALREAERNNIMSFCLTVDKSGHDYLREMCAPSRYMVLDDLAALPTELPKIYQRHIRLQSE